MPAIVRARERETELENEQASKGENKIVIDGKMSARQDERLA